MSAVGGVFFGLASYACSLHHTLSNHTMSASGNRVFLGPASRINWLDPGQGGSPAVQQCAQQALVQVKNATVQSSATDTNISSISSLRTALARPSAPDMSLEHTLAGQREGTHRLVRHTAALNPYMTCRRYIKDFCWFPFVIFCEVKSITVHV